MPSGALPAHPRRSGVAMMVVLGAVFASSCGQVAGAHQPGVALGLRARATVQPGASTLTPNGENTGPSRPIVGYKIITTTTTTKVPNKPPKLEVGGVPGRSPFLVCPVQGAGYFADDFGAPRYAGGFHQHQGNDIFAARGTPIVAPFDGYAVQTPNSLGGLAVTVYGAKGYVYNAHLAAYAKIGPVKAGDVVGYVGNTGDALGGPFHDHFEWHPRAIPASLHVSPYGANEVGGAIDPYPFLVAVCLPHS